MGCRTFMGLHRGRLPGDHVMRKLVIISHTDHQRDAEGRIVGWGPTVKEINHLAQHWDEVVHVACFEESSPRGSSLPYTEENIRLIGIEPFGGGRLKDKLGILLRAPDVISKVRHAIKDATHVQLRLPMGIGVYLLPYFSLRRRPFHFWVKYANNWKQEKAPKGYALQRWMLQRNLARCKTTINGFWDDQPTHCLSFENPSLQDEDILKGREIIAAKQYKSPFRFAFVGRLEEAKGVGRILDALRSVDLDQIDGVDFIGDGPEMQLFKEKAAWLGERASFHGFRSARFVKGVLAKSDFFLLPTTASEGFPKVVAEAACFGCIPVVSDTSSIPHYITHGSNGFVWRRQGIDGFDSMVRQVLKEDPADLARIAWKGNRLAEKFTLERYFHRLENEIFTP